MRCYTRSTARGRLESLQSHGRDGDGGMHHSGCCVKHMGPQRMERLDGALGGGLAEGRRQAQGMEEILVEAQPPPSRAFGGPRVTTRSTR